MFIQMINTVKIIYSRLFRLPPRYIFISKNIEKADVSLGFTKGKEEFLPLFSISSHIDKVHQFAQILKFCALKERRNGYQLKKFCFYYLCSTYLPVNSAGYLVRYLPNIECIRCKQAIQC